MNQDRMQDSSHTLLQWICNSTGGHKLESALMVLKLSSFFKDGTEFATSFITGQKKHN
ncbi:hypothetical protein BDA96_07G201800 [Sorghum bicolor]|uniref:Uncharacterized protein n=1 Tax=Sorghum bicolor TaxID=4558 RepID=A0A921QNX7_SORBI|nr:hypothetical protein BDA96_07G201800 [Sorghum bicolor]KAG0524330.1 hypothetical protein BDA96_07G201800 [Sorghum bicolor]